MGPPGNTGWPILEVFVVVFFPHAFSQLCYDILITLLGINIIKLDEKTGDVQFGDCWCNKVMWLHFSEWSSSLLWVAVTVQAANLYVTALIRSNTSEVATFLWVAVTVQAANLYVTALIRSNTSEVATFLWVAVTVQAANLYVTALIRSNTSEVATFLKMNSAADSPILICHLTWQKDEVEIETEPFPLICIWCQCAFCFQFCKHPPSSKKCCYALTVWPGLLGDSAKLVCERECAL